MEKEISYLNRTFEDYRRALIEYSRKYYPDLELEYDDASIGSWMIDLNAEIGDNLSYLADRVLQETNINSAKELSSIYALARNNGFKIPGPKGAMAEVRFTCLLPVSGDYFNPDYAPIIRRGTKVSSGSQSFELLDDIDFSKQFDKNGNSDREIMPKRDSNGVVVGYYINKYAVVVAGESKIYRQTISVYDIRPFMEILIPSENVMNVESVLVMDGSNYQDNPTYSQFYMPDETCEDGKGPIRFFEVDSLAQQRRWGDAATEPVLYGYKVVNEDNTENEVYTYSITKGEWKPLRHKFITEYTDKGYLKLIFGSGIEKYIPQDAYEFSKYQMSKVMNNPSLGVLPNPRSTLFVLYRVGGGSSSNLAAGAISMISNINVEFKYGLNPSIVSSIRSSITCRSTTPSVSGKDMPGVDELRYMIKYNAGAQERCVTVKDYVSRIMLLPPKYGTPFRVGVMEANNKIMVYLLGIDYMRKLDAKLPKTLVDNIENYLSGYRMINDYVEIKPGKIVNLSFEVDLFIDRNYNKADVATEVIGKIRDYMDIERHNMGDDIFVGDLEKEITKTDGVISIIDLRVYNETGINYSPTPIQQAASPENSSNSDRLKVDLAASDRVLYSDGDTMFEIKYPEKNIILNIKER